MSLFKTITNGMANAGTLIQENFEKLAKAIVSIDDTTGEIELGDVKVNNLEVSGTISGNQQFATKVVSDTSYKMDIVRASNSVTLTFTAIAAITQNTAFAIPAGYRAHTFDSMLIEQTSGDARMYVRSSVGTLVARTAIPANAVFSFNYSTPDDWPTD